MVCGTTGLTKQSVGTLNSINFQGLFAFRKNEKLQKSHGRACAGSTSVLPI